MSFESLALKLNSAPVVTILPEKGYNRIQLLAL